MTQDTAAGAAMTTARLFRMTRVALIAGFGAAAVLAGWLLWTGTPVTLMALLRGSLLLSGVAFVVAALVEAFDAAAGSADDSDEENQAGTPADDSDDGGIDWLTHDYIDHPYKWSDEQ